MRALYAGSDLHGNNNLIGIVDGQGKRIFKKRLPNDSELIKDVLKPFKEEMVGIVVESTYNWYWLVDALMEEGYKVHLANPSAIQQYSGLKHGDDKHDAFWLAEMLRLGILPEGYIYGALFRKCFHLSEGREAGERSSEKAGALGEAEDVSGDQPSEYSESEPGEESERQRCQAARRGSDHTALRRE